MVQISLLNIILKVKVYFNKEFNKFIKIKLLVINRYQLLIIYNFLFSVEDSTFNIKLNLKFIS